LLEEDTKGKIKKETQRHQNRLHLIKINILQINHRVVRATEELKMDLTRLQVLKNTIRHKVLFKRILL
jgi:hypothetical protein